MRIMHTQRMPMQAGQQFSVSEQHSSASLVNRRGANRLPRQVLRDCSMAGQAAAG